MGHAIIICTTRKGKFTARWQNEQNVEQCVSGMKDSEELALAEVKGIMERRAALAACDAITEANKGAM